MRNKHCFDYSNYIYSQKIYGSIFVDNSTNIQIIGHHYSFLYSIKSGILNCYKEKLPDNLYGLLSGMIIGNTSFIDEDILYSFKNSGITHLLSVSRK